MNVIQKHLRQINKTNPKLAEILEEYSEIERVYSEFLRATDFRANREPGVTNTADVTLFSRSATFSSADEWLSIKEVK